MSVDGLRAHYPELAVYPLTPVDIIDNGETLATVADDSQDFVVASHVIEHCENPLLAIRHWLRVVKAGGHVMMVVPDKRSTFDRERPVTPIWHILRDYAEGPEWSRWLHYEEVVRSQVKWSQLDDAQAAWAREIMAERRSIHFHVWRSLDFVEVLVAAGRLDFPFELVHFGPNQEEFIAVAANVRLSLPARRFGFGASSRRR
jgi:SAM-dependent methyltransferase